MEDQVDVIERDGGDSECEIDLHRDGDRVVMSITWRTRMLTTAQVTILDIEHARLIGSRFLLLAADA